MLSGILHAEWFVQGIGFVGLAAIFFALQMKERARILGGQITATIFFLIHYVLLGAYTGALTQAVIIVRNGVFLRKRPDKPLAIAWFYVFIAATIGTLAFSWAGWVSLLPVIGVCTATYAMWKDDPAEIRLFFLLSTFFWIPYLVIVNSYSGVITQIVIIVSVAIGMFKNDRRKISGS